jgi:hypothetical protein
MNARCKGIGAALGTEPLDRGDPSALQRGHRRQTRKDCLAVDDYRAGPALPETAAEFRAVEPEFAAENIKQRRSRI